MFILSEVGSCREYQDGEEVVVVTAPSIVGEYKTLNEALDLARHIHRGAGSGRFVWTTDTTDPERRQFKVRPRYIVRGPDVKKEIVWEGGNTVMKDVA